MDGAKTVVTDNSRCITVSRVQNQTRLKKCTVFELDSFTKYSILKNSNDESLYAKKTHFGWTKCGDIVAKDFAQSRVKIVEQNIGKKIMLKDIGQRNYSTGYHQKDLKQVGSIKTVDIGIDKILYNMMPIDYLQESYLSNNNCVWLSPCLVVHSIDPTQAENTLRMFKKIK